MRRFVAILLALVSGALAQVQPVASPAAPHKACCCCDHPGACGRPGCLPPPASAPIVLRLDQPVRLAVSPLTRRTPSARRLGGKFFIAFVSTAAVPAASRRPGRVALPATVPLFTAHCSFLI